MLWENGQHCPYRQEIPRATIGEASAGISNPGRTPGADRTMDDEPMGYDPPRPSIPEDPSWCNAWFGPEEETAHYSAGLKMYRNYDQAQPCFFSLHPEDLEREMPTWVIAALVEGRPFSTLRPGMIRPEDASLMRAGHDQKATLVQGRHPYLLPPIRIPLEFKQLSDQADQPETSVSLTMGFGDVRTGRNLIFASGFARDLFLHYRTPSFFGHCPSCLLYTSDAADE